MKTNNFLNSIVLSSILFFLNSQQKLHALPFDDAMGDVFGSGGIDSLFSNESDAAEFRQFFEQMEKSGGLEKLANSLPENFSPEMLEENPDFLNNILSEHLAPQEESADEEPPMQSENQSIKQSTPAEPETSLDSKTLFLSPPHKKEHEKVIVTITPRLKEAFDYFINQFLGELGAINLAINGYSFGIDITEFKQLQQKIQTIEPTLHSITKLSVQAPEENPYLKAFFEEKLKPIREKIVKAIDVMQGITSKTKSLQSHEEAYSKYDPKTGTFISPTKKAKPVPREEVTTLFSTYLIPIAKQLSAALNKPALKGQIDALKRRRAKEEQASARQGSSNRFSGYSSGRSSYGSSDYSSYGKKSSYKSSYDNDDYRGYSSNYSGYNSGYNGYNRYGSYGGGYKGFNYDADDDYPSQSSSYPQGSSSSRYFSTTNKQYEKPSSETIDPQLKTASQSSVKPATAMRTMAQLKKDLTASADDLEKSLKKQDQLLELLQKNYETKTRYDLHEFERQTRSSVEGTSQKNVPELFKDMQSTFKKLLTAACTLATYDVGTAIKKQQEKDQKFKPDLTTIIEEQEAASTIINFFLKGMYLADATEQVRSYFLAYEQPHLAIFTTELANLKKNLSKEALLTLASHSEAFTTKANSLRFPSITPSLVELMPPSSTKDGEPAPTEKALKTIKPSIPTPAQLFGSHQQALSALISDIQQTMQDIQARLSSAQTHTQNMLRMINQDTKTPDRISADVLTKLQPLSALVEQNLASSDLFKRCKKEMLRSAWLSTISNANVPLAEELAIAQDILNFWTNAMPSTSESILSQVAEQPQSAVQEPEESPEASPSKAQENSPTPQEAVVEV